MMKVVINSKYGDSFFIVTFLLLFSFFNICGCTSLITKYSTSKREAELSVTDQDISAKVAFEDEENFVRSIATSRLSDQKHLVKLALEDKANVVRGAAVARVTDQNVLIRVVLEDRNWRVRMTAATKLTDQQILAKVALSDVNWHVRMAAAGNLEDQKALAKMVLEDKSSYVRKVALSRLTDREILARVILEDRDEEVRKAAVMAMDSERHLKTTLEKGILSKHTNHAAQLRLMTLDPIIIKTLGKLKITYEHTIKDSKDYDGNESCYGKTVEVEEVCIRINYGSIADKCFKGAEAGSPELFVVGRCYKKNYAPVKLEEVALEIVRELPREARVELAQSANMELLKKAAVKLVGKPI